MIPVELSSPDPAQVERQRTEAKVSPISRRLLALRGVTGGADASNFLSPSLDNSIRRTCCAA